MKTSRCLAFFIVVTACTVSSARQPASKYDHRQLMQFADQPGTLQPAQTASDWEKRKRHILEGIQAATGELPSRGNLPDLDPQVLEETDLGDVIRTRLTIVSEVSSTGDIDRVPAYLLRRKDGNGKQPAILALHQTTPTGKAEVAGIGGKSELHYGLELARRGYVVLVPDYPSFGDYKYDFDNDRYESGTAKGIWNHRRALDYLASRTDVDAERIGAIGHSLGGHNALFVAAFDDRIKAVVTNCGWTPFHDYYGGKLKGWTSDRYMPRIQKLFGSDPDRVPFDFAEVIGAIAPRAVLSISPERDDNFSVDGVRRGIAAASAVYKLLGREEQLQALYPKCGHEFPPEMREAAYAFLDKQLSNERSRSDDDDLQRQLRGVLPREPAEALATFELNNDFELQQVATEPNVVSPVAVSFDENGRMFVVEMRDYPESPDEQLGRVRLLEDRDGDGKHESSTVFAHSLSWPTAIICYGGGVFVGAAPDIWYLKDTDGDGQADERRVVFTGFGKSNVQGLLNSLTWGLDNRIHGATSSSGAKVTRPDRPDDKPLVLSGRDFSFDPRSLEIAAESGGGQHGLTFDDFGNKFVCSNSDHLQAIVLEDRYLARNPLVSGQTRESIAVDGGQAPVFRASPVEAWRVLRTELRVSGKAPGPIEGGGTPAGYFTGATGVMVYRGDAWSKEYHGQVIVGDVGSNLVHRKRLSPRGTSWTGERIDQNTEFLRSTDIWFRPAGFANAPDGTLYVIDMYREVIEHPASLPPEIKRHLDLSSGRERGRIYRIAPRQFAARKPHKLSGASTVELVQLLANGNGWTRDTAQRLLYERQDMSAIKQLGELLEKSTSSIARMHALYTLRSLDSLDSKRLIAALNDTHARVRQHAIRLSEPMLRSGDQAIANAILGVAGDSDPRVQLQLALTLGETSDPRRIELLSRLAMTDGDDPRIATAIAGSLADGASDVALGIIRSQVMMRRDDAPAVLVQLLQMIGRQARADEVRQVIRSLNSLGESELLRMQCSTALAKALNQKGGKRSLKEMLIDLADDDGAGLHDWLTSTAPKIAVDRSRSIPERRVAIGALTLLEWKQSETTYRELLALAQSPEIQTVAVQSMPVAGEPAAAALIVECWQQLALGAKPIALDALLSSTHAVTQLLAAVEANQIARAEVDPGRRRLLERHSSETIRTRAATLFGLSPARTTIVEKYQAALTKVGDRARGQEVFAKQCASCHRIGETGHEIGPSLPAAMARGAESVLINVFDPNREVNPQYLSYAALTADGRTMTGLIASESASSVTLRRADGASETILRSDLDELRSTGVSLMPEGLEQQLDEQAFADLLTFLKSAQ